MISSPTTDGSSPKRSHATFLAQLLLPGLLLFGLSCPTHAQERVSGAGTMPTMAMPAGVDVLTRSFDLGRTGANTAETQLTPATVAKGLKKQFSLHVTGDAANPDDPRIEAQPLIVTNLKMSDGQVHNVVYLCTMENHVWTFDADTGAKIWEKPVSLGRPVAPHVLQPGERGYDPNYKTRTTIDLWGINLHWGVLSTPVIDRATNTLYIVNWTSPDGTTGNAFFQLHALRLTDGKERKGSPVKIETSVNVGGETAHFIPNRQKQRSALLLLPLPNAHLHEAGQPTVLSGGMGDEDQPAAGPAVEDHLDLPATGKNVLIMACGLIGENSAGEHGWILAFDPKSLKLTATFCTTPTTGGGGIWHAGQGPAGDTGGNIYVMTSNGGFNGTTDFSESFLMLHYTPPPANTTQGKLEVTTWFTPFRDADRIQNEPGTGYNFQDQDLGSGGPVVPRGLGLVMGAGKDGVIYVLGKGKFGNTTERDIDSHSQFAALKSPPIFFTYFHGFGVDATRLAVLDQNFQGKTHHQHHTPVYWESPDVGPMLFCWGENENLRAWSVTPAGEIKFLAMGQETASAGAPGMGGMPGGMLTLTANAQVKHSGIVWTTAPISGDGNRHVVEGIIRAYAATDFIEPHDNDPNATLRLLWDSHHTENDPGNRFNYNKFCPPIVANGKLYVTTYDGRVDVYGP